MTIKGSSINHFEEVRLFITRYKLKAQCRDTQTSRSCVPKGRDVYTEFIEPTLMIIHVFKCHSHEFSLPSNVFFYRYLCHGLSY